MQLPIQIWIFYATVVTLTIGQDIECPLQKLEYFQLNDCTKYILYGNGESSEIQCPAGLLFNPDIKVCDVPQNVPDCKDGKRGVLTQCGQTIKANKGAIEYKLNQKYDAGELCVFILRHNISTNPGFRFVLESHGISRLDRDAIHIITFRPEKSISTRFISKSTSLGPPNLIPVATSEGYVAIVVFRTSSSSGTGFRMSFKGTGDQNITAGHNDGQDVAYNDETESPVSLPIRPNCTGYGCLDVFAFTSESKLVTDPDSYFRLSIHLNPLNSSEEFACLDTVSVMEYHREQYFGGGCWSDNTRQHVYESRGMFFTVFVSFTQYPSTATLSWEKVKSTGYSVTKNQSVLTECGKTLNANSGTIEYKLNRPYDAGEFCVFIIRHTISTNPGFRFLLESHGISEFDLNSITIFTLSPRLTTTFDIDYETYYLGPPYLDPLLNADLCVAVVIFKTYTNSGTGFKLSYEATGDPDPMEAYNIGLNLIANSALSFSYGFQALSMCSAPSCADVFVMTSGKSVITDPSVFFKLSMILNTLPTGSIPYEQTCINVFAIQDLTFGHPTGINDCWPDSGDPREFVFDTRGMFILIITYKPGSRATGEITWSKVNDPQH